MSGTLEIENLRVQYHTQADTVHAVNGVSFEIKPGEVVGLVGESGCGKSVTARSLIRLESPGEIVAGSIQYNGQELTTANERTLRQLRGQELAMVFQDPSATLNPVYPVGEQIAEALRVHRNPDRQPFLKELAVGASSRLRSSELRSEVLELMTTVGIPRPSERIDAYPHQFSGGMRQRAMLAIALARQPSVLIADEPTTALDTTTQAAILERLSELNDDHGMGMLVISHDFGVVSALCDRLVVMYNGVVVEQGPTGELRSNPAHPYTKALLGCLPRHADPQSPIPTVEGSPSDRATPSPECAFADRCPFATDDCRESDPSVVTISPNRTVRCDVPEARNASIESIHRQSDTPAGTSDILSPVAVDGGTDTATADITSSPDSIGDSTTRESIGPGRDPGDESTRSDELVVELENVTKSFRRSDALVDRLLGNDDRIPAVRGVSLKLQPGETVGLVGESGCGKSTLAQLFAGLEVPDNGRVRLRGQQVGGVDIRTAAQLSEIGVVFQHPDASLNPKRTVTQAIAEPLLEAGLSESDRDARITALLDLVGLSPAIVDRYPGQLSGGQCQRVAIARALALQPSILVLDEPTAALDVSIQATVLNLLARLQKELDLAYLFVSHDLEVIHHAADRVAVMYLGKLAEVGPASQVLSQPSHPYTQTLLESIPGTSRTSGKIFGGELPDPADPPAGCMFHPRCPIAEDECKADEPTFAAAGDARSRCHYAADCYENQLTNENESKTDQQRNL